VLWLTFWKCHNCTSLHVCLFIFNYSFPPQVAFASLDGNDNGGGSFSPYNPQIHGDGRFAILAAAAAKGAGMEFDSNNNNSFSCAQAHWEGKFGRGAIADDGVDDDEDDDGGRDVDFAPPHNCKFSMLATTAAAENARMEDDSNTNGVGTSDNEVINAGGKFCGVRIYDECNDGGIVGTFGTFPQQPHIPTDAGFSLLAAIAADGGIGDDDNAYLNEDHDGTLILCTSPVQDIDDNIENICRNDKSNDHLIDAVLGENCDGSYNEFFTNGLGLSIVSRGHNHRGILETQKRKASFLATWSGPSSILRALPFIRQRRRKGRVHYFADVFLVVTMHFNLGLQVPM
jgi:hypothetical protein